MSKQSLKRGERKQQILEALASELEHNQGTPVTTANLAKAVGISEAALYRHFPSKAKMFESLIEFAEETIFTIAARIESDEASTSRRCEKVLKLILGFSDRNPGITRILLGDALIGEPERLRNRISQFYDRVETLLKQFLREGLVKREVVADSKVNAISNLFLSLVTGRMAYYARGGFTQSPLEHWEDQWELISSGLFRMTQEQLETAEVAG